MKNKISDPNNHLFAQIERLSEEGCMSKDIITVLKSARATIRRLYGERGQLDDRVSPTRDLDEMIARMEGNKS